MMSTDASSLDLPRELVTVPLCADATRIRLYAEVTGDFNPLHIDAAFAARTPFGKPIAHGTMVLNLVWQALSASFPDGSAYWELDIRFIRPVREGTTVTAGGRLENAEAGIYKVEVTSDEGEVVLAGEARILNPAMGKAAT